MLLAVSFFHITTTLPVTVCYSLYYSFPPGNTSLTEVQIAADPVWQIHLAYYATKVCQLRLYSVSRKIPLRFSDISSQTVGDFSPNFTRLLYAPVEHAIISLGLNGSS